MQSQQLRGLPDTHWQQGQAGRRKFSCPEKEGVHWSGLGVWLSQQTHLPDQLGMHWKWWNYLVYVELPSQGYPQVIVGLWHQQQPWQPVTTSHFPLTIQYFVGIFRDKKLWASHFKTVNSFFTVWLFSKPKRTMEGLWRCSVPYIMCSHKAGWEDSVKSRELLSHAMKMCLNNLHRADTTGTRGLIIWDSTRTTIVRCERGFAPARI